MGIDLKELDIKKAHSALRAGEFSSRELVESCLKNIDDKDKDVGAFLEVFSDSLDQADRADKLIQSGKADVLTGIPIAVKDNILIKGRVASAASKMLENFRAPYDSFVSEKLKKSNAVFLGRTNMDEFAMGSSTENSAFGVTKTPHDPLRVAGGSSGGSAAAVSMGGGLVALGSDTGGSIRQPASFCGCVGFKPTYGRVSRSGLIAMGSSLDQIGPFGKSVSDAEIMFNLLKGKDPKDSTTVDDNITQQGEVVKEGKAKIGVPAGWVDREGVSREVKENFNSCIKKLKDLGYEMEEVEVPDPSYSLATYYIIMPAEVSSNLARYDGVKYGMHREGRDLLDDYFSTRGEGFGKEVRRRVLLGTYVLSSGYHDEYYNKAQAVRKIITREYNNVFEKIDAIISPTTPTPAFKVGEKSSDPLAMYMSDIFTSTANITGAPAISVPSGFVEVEGKSLPLGLQIMANNFKEDTVFAVARDFLGEDKN